MKKGKMPTSQALRPVWVFAFGLLLSGLSMHSIFVPKIAFAQEQLYTCPMHPHYIATEPGSCPICGMDLTAVAKADTPNPVDKAQDVQANDKKTSNRHRDDASPKRKAVVISPETIQNMGVRVAPAEPSLFGASIRSYGVIQANTRLAHTVSGRVAGWVETLSITAVGDEIKVGDELFTLYSPDLVSAQQDYLSALTSGRSGRIKAAKARLKALGVGEQVLTQLKATRRALRNVPFYFDNTGSTNDHTEKAVVSELFVRQGAYIQSGQTLATLQSYESVWVNVSVAEKDLSFIEMKTLARVTLPNIGGEVRVSKVDYVHPTIDTASRTGQVRLVLDNKDGRLKPGAYADVVFETQVQNRLSVPSEAILKSAEGDYVVLAEGDGRFQPQSVNIGVENSGRSEVLRGIIAGDSVVVSGQFLLDSESSLRESFHKLQRMQQPLNKVQLTSDQQAMLDHLVDAALYLHERLIQEKAIQRHMLTPALKMINHVQPSLGGTQLTRVLDGSEQALVAAQAAVTQSQAKAALSDLSASLKPWVEARADYYRGKGIKLFFDHVSGLYWFQLGQKGAPLHPYGDGHAVEVPLTPVADKALGEPHGK